MAQCFCMPITLSNSNRFSKLLHLRNQEKICSNTVNKDATTPHLICVATLPCEMLDITLKPATTLTNNVISVDRAWHVAPIELELESLDYAARRTHWTFDVKLWQLLWTITETINRLFPVVSLVQVLLFQISSCFQLLLLRHWYFTR